MKVSVVVPVYNPGRYIQPCIDSLLHQSLDPTEYEAVFVNDGSTDGTGDRLDALAAEHENIRVIHNIPGSGWPGKPRNIGIDAARGEYVQFVDQDDNLTPEALERLYDLGRRSDADIVIGKVISDFRGVPHKVFRDTRERCTIRTAPLIDSLTPHKMFRRAFLDEFGIRYPEGKRRLEDQLFMVRSYLAASSVAILGDYVCYFYNKRDDGKNAGSRRIEPAGYYGNLAEIFDVIESKTEPGEFRDGLLRRFYRGEMLGRIGRLHKYGEDLRVGTYTEVRKLATTRLPHTVHDGLPASLRVRSQLLLDDRFDDLVTLAEVSEGVKAAVFLSAVGWSGGALTAAFDAGLAFRDSPMRFIRRGERTYLDPAVIGSDVPPEARDVTDDLADFRVELFVRERESAVEFFVPTRFTTSSTVVGHTPDGGEYLTFTASGEATIDPRTALGGQPLPRGVWDVSARIDLGGWVRNPRVGAHRAPAVDRSTQPALVGEEPLIVIPYYTKPYGNLSIDIGQVTRPLLTVAPVRRQRVAVQGDHDAATVEIPIQLLTTPDVPATTAQAQLLVPGTTEQAAILPARVTRLTDAEAVASFTLPRRGTDGVHPGKYAVSMRVAGKNRMTALGLTLLVRRSGPPSVRATGGRDHEIQGPVKSAATQVLAHARHRARRIPQLRRAVRLARRARRRAFNR